MSNLFPQSSVLSTLRPRTVPIASGQSMIQILILLAAALLYAAPAEAVPFTVVCNGDSNTQSNWQGPTTDGWCERLGVKLGTSTINRGVGGSGIVDSGLVYGAIPLYGGFYLTEELGEMDPFFDIGDGAPSFLGQPIHEPFPLVDVVIFAWGTNDIRDGYTAKQVIAAIKKYRKMAIAAGATVLVATTPPIFNTDGSLSSSEVSIKKLNSLIRGNFPSKYVEFHDGMVPGDYFADGVHLAVSGQEKRAQAAFDAITHLHAVRSRASVN